jgi:signal recognition particle GTPase
MPIAFKIFIPLILVLCTCFSFAQNKYEREFRIRKGQFPTTAKNLLDTHVKNVKRLKFYKETDSTKSSYEAKFKKERLWYSMEFDVDGALEDIEITIESLDIPSDVLSNITTYLNKAFSKHRVKKIQQQYLASAEEKLQKTLRNAFQNLLIPSLNYEIIVSGKENRNYLEYEILFDAQGNFINRRKQLPPIFDHVLY